MVFTSWGKHVSKIGISVGQGAIFGALVACQSGPPITTPPIGDCAYPVTSEPMAQGEVLPPYQWSVARHRDGERSAPLSVVNAFCGIDDENMEWSALDALLFVSIPAW